MEGPTPIRSPRERKPAPLYAKIVGTLICLVVAFPVVAALLKLGWWILHL